MGTNGKLINLFWKINFHYRICWNFAKKIFIIPITPETYQLQTSNKKHLLLVFIRLLKIVYKNTLTEAVHFGDLLLHMFHNTRLTAKGCTCLTYSHVHEVGIVEAWIKNTASKWPWITWPHKSIFVEIGQFVHQLLTGTKSFHHPIIVSTPLEKRH
jgi:hypothetical protein